MKQNIMMLCLLVASGLVHAQQAAQQKVQEAQPVVHAHINVGDGNFMYATESTQCFCVARDEHGEQIKVKTGDILMPVTLFIIDAVRYNTDLLLDIHTSLPLAWILEKIKTGDITVHLPAFGERAPVQFQCSWGSNFKKDLEVALTKYLSNPNFASEDEETLLEAGIIAYNPNHCGSREERRCNPKFLHGPESTYQAMMKEVRALAAAEDEMKCAADAVAQVWDDVAMSSVPPSASLRQRSAAEQAPAQIEDESAKVKKEIARRWGRIVHAFTNPQPNREDKIIRLGFAVGINAIGLWFFSPKFAW